MSLASKVSMLAQHFIDMRRDAEELLEKPIVGPLSREHIQQRIISYQEAYEACIQFVRGPCIKCLLETLRVLELDHYMTEILNSNDDDDDDMFIEMSTDEDDIVFSMNEDV